MMTKILFDFNEDVSSQEDNVIEGFVEQEMTMIFPVRRIIEAEVIPHNKKKYMRTREVAAILDCRQPFQFTADIKKRLGNKAIVKGDETASFRNEKDGNKTTFIEITALYLFLLQERNSKDRYDQVQLDKFINELKKMIKK